MLSLLRVFPALLALASVVGVAAQDAQHASSGEFNRALGVECGFCHVPAGAATPPARATARRMIEMVSALNERLQPLGGRVTCWTCHAGARVPVRLERPQWERVLAEWPASLARTSKDVKLTMSVYSASVGRRCAGCHEDGTGPAAEEAVHLVETMTSLFAVMEKFMPPTARSECFMCHKGRPHPQIGPAD